MLRAILGLLLCTALTGCTTLVLWNPRFGDAELDREISLNVDGVAVEVSKFGFWNSSHTPTAHVSIKNFTDEVVHYEAARSRIRVREQSIEPAKGDLAPIALRPGEKKSVVVSYEYKLEHGPLVQSKHGDCYVPSAADISLLLGNVKLGSREVAIPTIDYVYAYRNCRRTRFL